MGPVGTIEEWYAQARLAVNVCTLIVLGSSAPPGGLALSYVSRCMDKDSLYSLSIMKHFLSNFFVPQRTKQLTVWSDVGKHFRSKRTIPTLAYRVCGDFDYMAGTPLMEAMKLSSYFGMPRNFNNLCDKEFAWQNGCSNQCTKRCTIKTVSDQIACWQAYHDKALNNNPSTQARLFIDYVPEPKPDILKWSIKVKALGAPIFHSHSMQMTSADGVSTCLAKDAKSIH